MKKIAFALLTIVSLGLIVLGTLSLLHVELYGHSADGITSWGFLVLGLVILLALHFGYLRVRLSANDLDVIVRDTRRPKDLPGYEDIEEE